METNNSSKQENTEDPCEQVDLEVAEVYVSFLIRRAVKDKSAIDDKSLKVQDAVETWNRGIAEEPGSNQKNSRAKRARFNDGEVVGAAKVKDSEPEDSERENRIDNRATTERKTNSKIKNRQIEGDAKHSQSRLGQNQARLTSTKDSSTANTELEHLRHKGLKENPTPSGRGEHSSKNLAAKSAEKPDSADRGLPAGESRDDRDTSRVGGEEEGSENSERQKALPWSYMNTYSGYSLKDHPYIEKKKRKLQKQLEMVRKSREEAERSSGFYQPFEYEEAIKQQSRQEELFTTSIANVDRKLEEFYQKKRAREQLTRDADLPPISSLKPKMELVIPKKETTDWVRELAQDRRLREERMRLREEKRVRKAMEEEQARQQQQGREAQQKKRIRLARVQGHLEEMAQKREVFQQVNRYQNKIIKDLISRPQVFYYVRPSEEAMQRVREKLKPMHLRQADPQADHFESNLQDFDT